MNARLSRIPGFPLAASLLALSVSAHADTFGSGADTFTIDFVTIGNPGNSDDRAFDHNNDTPGDPNDDEYASPYGGVAYTYRMGVTEVPYDWIDKATTLGLIGVAPRDPGSGQLPAGGVSWYEAAAFVNWLNTSTGHQAAYNLTQIPRDIFGNIWNVILWSSEDAWQLGGENVYRHKDAYYFLPSEDEWYKAAYHKNDGVTANYWDYATGSNTIPTAVASGTTTGTAVYGGGAVVEPAAVNLAGGLSPYGTRGQNGNEVEWQESAFDAPNDHAFKDRVERGGNWRVGEGALRSSFRNDLDPDIPFDGFRVASIPEPGTAALLGVAAFPLLLRRRRLVLFSWVRTPMDSTHSFTTP